MSCYHPTYIRRSIDKISGLVEHKYIGKALDDRFLQRDYGGRKQSDILYNSFDQEYETWKYKVKYIQVPCGRCIGCRIDYSRSWADRMTYHVMTQPKDVNWFVTLTYDDEYLERLPLNNDHGLYSLDYSHKDEFMKNLRNKYRDCSIDFYLSGEYGGSTARPHFHAILYNVPFDDLVFWMLNDCGDPIYLSDDLQSIWQYGFCTIAPFTWTCAAYTARYVEKKSFGYDSAEYKAFGLEPEKSFQSRRPGLSKDYYLEHYTDLWHNFGLNVDLSVNASGKLGIPRYFRKLAFDKGIGKEEATEAILKSTDLQNVVNPLSIQNSSFDLSRVQQMLNFEENNVIHGKKLRM